MSRLGIESNEGTLQVRGRARELGDGVEVGEDRVLEPIVRFDVIPSDLHRGPRRRLQLKVERGIDAEATAVDLRPEAVVQNLSDPLLEVRGDPCDIALRLRFGEREGLPPRGFGARQVPLSRHAIENEVPASPGPVGISERIVACRDIENGGEERGFSHVHVHGVLPEVPARRILEAVPTAHVDLVEVRFEDLILRVGRLQLKGDLDLLELSHVPTVEADLIEHVSGELLGDRAPTTLLPTECQNTEDGPRDADGIEAPMLVEPFVLSGDDGLRHVVGQGLNGHRCPPLESDFSYLLAIVRKDLAHLLMLEGPNLCDRRTLVPGTEVLPGPPRAPESKGGDEGRAEEKLRRIPVAGEFGGDACFAAVLRSGFCACHHGQGISRASIGA